MTGNRPPLTARWEYHLLTAVVSGLAIALPMRPRHVTPAMVEGESPELRAWLERRRTGAEAYPGASRLRRERDVLRVVSGAWLAWRAFQLERTLRVRGHDGTDGPVA